MDTIETEIRELVDTRMEHFPDRSTRWLFKYAENVQGLIQIVALLQFRFEPVPASLINEIHAIRSLSHLDSLFETALAAETLEDIHLQNHVH